jgi:hypothetical protein
MQGDQTRHDDLIVSTLDAAARSNDVVVLAQASMARVLPRLEASLQTKVLTSPPFAVSEVVDKLQAQGLAPSI